MGNSIYRQASSIYPWEIACPYLIHVHHGYNLETVRFWWMIYSQLANKMSGAIPFLSYWVHEFLMSLFAGDIEFAKCRRCSNSPLTNLSPACKSIRLWICRLLVSFRHDRLKERWWDDHSSHHTHIWVKPILGFGSKKFRVLSIPYSLKSFINFLHVVWIWVIRI